MTFRPRKIDRERVARGAAILDQEFPGWEQHVNWSSLVISSSTNCVLAQVGRSMLTFNVPMSAYDGSLRGYTHAELRCERRMSRSEFGGDLTEFGFNIDYLDGASNQRLALAWKTEIEARLNSPKPKKTKRGDFALAA